MLPLRVAGFVAGLCLDLLFGREEPFEYVSRTTRPMSDLERALRERDEELDELQL